MANPLVLIVPINLSINKPVYGRFLGNRFWNANDRQRLFCVFSALCKALHINNLSGIVDFMYFTFGEPLDLPFQAIFTWFFA